MAGVKAVLSQFDLEQIDVARKLVVDHAQELRRVHLLGQIDVRDLMQGMNAGVGAPGAVDLDDALAGGAMDRLHDLARDGAGVGLELPAAVARPHVFEVDPVSEAVFGAGGPGGLSVMARRRRLVTGHRARHMDSWGHSSFSLRPYMLAPAE